MSSALPLRELQQRILERFDRDAWFDEIPILTESLGDVVKMVDIAVAKIGTCVVVETPVAHVEHPGPPSIFYDTVPIVCTVWENVIINHADGGSQVHALDTAQIMSFLLQFRPSGFNDLVLRNPTIVKASDPLLVGYHVFAETSVGFRYDEQVSLATNDNDRILTNAGIHIIGN